MPPRPPTDARRQSGGTAPGGAGNGKQQTNKGIAETKGKGKDGEKSLRMDQEVECLRQTIGQAVFDDPANVNWWLSGEFTAGGERRKIVSALEKKYCTHCLRTGRGWQTNHKSSECRNISGNTPAFPCRFCMAMDKGAKPQYHWPNSDARPAAK